MLKRLQPWFGVVALCTLCYFFYQTVNQEGIQLTPPSLGHSILLLILLPSIVLFKVMSWWFITKDLHIQLSLPETFRACLYSIAGRYLPGKVFFIVARVQAYASNKQNLALATLGMFVEFIVENMAGCILLIWAGISHTLPKSAQLWALVALLLFMLGTITPFIIKRLAKHSLFKRHLPDLVVLNQWSPTISPVLFTMAHWFAYLTCIALLHPHLNLSLNQWVAIGAVLGFSSTVGTISIFAPGGIGVREGLATLLFAHLGIDPNQAFQLAIAARITQWASEILCALMFILADCFVKQQKLSS
jgi:uncharacterized membrane protein YbhN (UPF0104 family)